MDRVIRAAAAHSRLFAVALALLAGSSLHAPRADAATEATVGVSGGVLTFADLPDYSTTVTMELNSGNYQFSGMPMIAEAGCIQVTPSSATCAAAPVSSIVFSLGGGAEDSSDFLTVLSAADPISITSGELDDEVYLGAGDLSTVTGSVTWDAGAGTLDSLFLDDALLTTAATYTVGSTITRLGFPGVSYTNTEQVFVYGTAQGDTFNAGGSPIGAAVILEGGPGNDTANIGTGNLDPLAMSSIEFRAGDGSDFASIDDSASPYAGGYGIGSTSLSRGGTFSAHYSNIESVEFDAATGNNFISMLSAPAQARMEINAGGGDDVVFVGSGGLSLIASRVNLSGGPGALDEIQFNDQDASGSYTLERSQMTAAGTPTVGYTAFEKVGLVSAEGPSFVDIISTAEGVTTEVYGLGDNDIIRVSAPGLAATGSTAIIGGTHTSMDVIEFHTGGLASSQGFNVINTPGKQAVFHQQVELVNMNTPTDSDGDGCSDVHEGGLDPTLGGDRNPFAFRDFFDVNGNQTIGLDDTLAILGTFGLGPADPGYDASYDRVIPDSAKRWRTAAAAGPAMGITLEDALANLQSFGHDCT